MSQTVIIVDDEAPARRRVRMLLQEHTDLNIIRECDTGRSAVLTINTLKPEVVFLDIRLNDMHGFDVLKELSYSPVIIFVTAHDQFAINAFNHFAFDFILKPYSDERLLASVARMKERLKSSADFDHQIEKLLNYIQRFENQQSSAKKYLHVRKNNRIILINIADIQYVKASGNYCDVILPKQKHIIREAIGKLEKRLDQMQFIRIHRSTIININALSEIIHTSHGEIEAKLNTGTILRVSRNYQLDFLKKVELR